MELLVLSPLTRAVRRSDLIALLRDAGGLAQHRIGNIDLAGGRAAVEVPDGWADRLARTLDGALLGGRSLRAWVSRPAGAASGEEDHFARLARLLRQESSAEAKVRLADRKRPSPRDAEQRGDTLVDLAVEDVSAGLGGRAIVSLVKRNRELSLPWTRLDVGSPVLLSPMQAERELGFRAVVSRRDRNVLEVALADLPDEIDEYPAWRVDLSSDEATREKSLSALDQARSAPGGRLSELRGVLLAERPAAFRSEAPLAPFDAALDQAQQAAIRHALAAADLALIHGPPGTGKTTAVVELVRQAAAQGLRVLVCAASNLAVDNVFERLLAADVNAVRLGHPARVLPGLREHTLDELVESHDDLRLARKLVKEAFALRRRAERFTRARPAPGARAEMRLEARALFADARRLERGAVEQVLDQAAVVCATLTSLHDDVLGARRFDLAVIDEAAQSTEPPCWIPLLRAEKLVLAGDPCQLPPTVVSAEAARDGLATSLMERLLAADEQAARLLSVQYRMHQAIMGFSSRMFYGDQLVAAPSVAEHLLSDLPGVARSPLSQEPLLFIDTAGAGYDEKQEDDGPSRFNPAEARLACRKAAELIALGVSPCDIAVITPYSAQARLIRAGLADLFEGSSSAADRFLLAADRLLLAADRSSRDPLRPGGVEVDSVDGFQGREKEAVIVSLVRSCDEGEIGFLADTRRMNVAWTRARRKLIVIGDSATLCGHPFYREMVDYFESRRAYHTVWEEPEE